MSVCGVDSRQRETKTQTNSPSRAQNQTSTARDWTARTVPRTVNVALMEPGVERVSLLHCSLCVYVSSRRYLPQCFHWRCQNTARLLCCKAFSTYTASTNSDSDL